MQKQYTHSGHSRRDFLRTAALATGGLLTAAYTRLSFAEEGASKTARWALLSDTHVSQDPTEKNRQFVINDNMKTVVAQVLEAKPQGALITGDLARLEGRVGDYEQLRAIVKPLRDALPVAFALGNHDDRRNFVKLLAPQVGELAPLEKQVRIIDLDPAGVRFICLDSLLYVNRVAGFLGKPQRRWLGQTLDAAPDRPTFLFVHHTFGESESNLLDTDEFLAVIAPRKSVKAVFYGHSHEYRYSRKEDIHFVNIPAIGYSFNDKEPVGWVEGKFTAEGGDFTLHAFASNTADDGKTKSLSWRS